MAHQVQLTPADQAARRVGQLDVQAHRVRGAQQVVQRDEADAQLGRALGGGVERPGLHVHADGAAEAGQFGADGAGADDAEGLAAEVDVLAGAPAAFAHEAGLVGDAAGRGEHQGQGVLGDDGGGAAGYVADHDAERPGGVEVGGVGADAADGDHAQRRQPAQHGAGPPHGAARVNQARCPGGAADLLLVVGGAIAVEHHLAAAAQPVQVRRALELRWVVAGDRNAR
jgi:hypothetical protein